MRKLEHIGKVVEVSESSALVELRPSECRRAGFACSCCASAEAGPRTLKVARDALKEGDVVRVSVPAYVGYLSSFVVFVLPIVLIVTGAIVGWIAKGEAAAHDTPIIVGGVCGFVLAVAVALAVNHRLADARSFEVSRLEQDGP
ncbi:MAG: SoxR reducing system RseC family protein [Planctomycetota bacterium]|jgi:positive regulator of sigma E activity